MFLKSMIVKADEGALNVLESKKEALMNYAAMMITLPLLITVGKLITVIPFFNKVKNWQDMNAWGFLTPEPAERMVFLVSLALFPAVFLIFRWLLKKPLDSLPSDRVTLTYNAAGFTALTALIVLFAVILDTKMRDTDYSYFHNTLVLNNTFGYVFFAVSAAILVFSYSAAYKGQVIYGKADNILGFFVDAAAAAVILIVPFETAHRIQDAYHFEAVFYSVAQVFNGKNALIDFTTQYGLYAHFLKPLFIILGGLTVWKFKMIMSVLIVISLSAFYIFLRNVIKNRILLLIVFAAAVYYAYSAFYNDYRNREYYQYFPLRTIFPMLFLLLGSMYIKRKSAPVYYTTTLLLSAGVLWNPDSGATAFAAWTALLVYGEACLYRKGVISGIAFIRKLILHITTNFSVLVSVFILFGLGIYVSAGVFPDYSLLVLYQKIYYAMGFGAMPMTPIHMWNIVVLCLAAGLVIAIGGFVDGEASGKEFEDNRYFFMLSILGLGLFAYYQGRSHDWALVPLFYLPVAMAGMLADRINLKLRDFYRQNTTDLVRAGFFIFLIFILFAPVPVMYNKIKKINLKHFYSKVWEGRLIKELPENVRDVIPKGEKVYVVSDRMQSLVYAETGAVSPINVPGQIEITLGSQIKKVKDFLAEESPGRMLALDTSDGGAYLNHFEMKLNDNYKRFAAFRNSHLEIYRQFDFENQVNSVFGARASMFHAVEFGNYIYTMIKNGKYEKNFLYDSGIVVDWGQVFSIEAVLIPSPAEYKNVQVFGDLRDGKGIALYTDSLYPNGFRLIWMQNDWECKSPIFYMEEGKPAYLAVVNDNNKMSVYVNGSRIYTTAGGVKKGKTTFRMNNNWDGYSGRIPELQITGRVKTEAEITEVYKKVLKKFATGQADGR